MHTAEGILKQEKATTKLRNQLGSIAESYQWVYDNQGKQVKSGIACKEDFWGLRDFYSLIRALSKTTNIKYDDLSKAVGRNLNGLGKERYLQNIASFSNNMNLQSPTTAHQPPVLSLIKSNLQDPSSRHLMVVQIDNTITLDHH